MHQRLRQRRLIGSALSRFLRLVSSSSSSAAAALPLHQATANDDGSPRAARGSGGGTAGAGRRWWGATLTRADLLVFLLAAALCSASYSLAIWHNSRGAADSRVLGPSAAVVVATFCGDDAPGEPLDFETHHAAEDAGLSVSTAAAKTTTTSTPRRALRGVAWAAAGAGAGGRTLRFTDAVAVQA